MTTKPIRNAPASDTPTADLKLWNLMADLGRQQFAFATWGVTALLRGSEAMRTIQQHAAHQACAAHEAAWHKLQQPSQPGDLLAIQSDLLRQDMQGAMTYWPRLATEMLKTQMSLMASASASTLPDVPAGLAFNPMLDAWQAAVAGSQGGDNGAASHRAASH